MNLVIEVWILNLSKKKLHLYSRLVKANYVTNFLSLSSFYYLIRYLYCTHYILIMSMSGKGFEEYPREFFRTMDWPNTSIKAYLKRKKKLLLKNECISITKYRQSLKKDVIFEK